MLAQFSMLDSLLTSHLPKIYVMCVFYVFDSDGLSQISLIYEEKRDLKFSRARRDF